MHFMVAIGLRMVVYVISFHVLHFNGFKTIDCQKGNFTGNSNAAYALSTTLQGIKNWHMKFGYRTPSLKKRIAAKTSLKRVVRHNLGFKAPRGFGWFTNPKKAAYNRVYNRTSRGCMLVLIILSGFLFSIVMLIHFLTT